MEFYELSYHILHQIVCKLPLSDFKKLYRNDPALRQKLSKTNIQIVPDLWSALIRWCESDE